MIFYDLTKKCVWCKN